MTGQPGMGYMIKVLTESRNAISDDIIEFTRYKEIEQVYIDPDFNDQDGAVVLQFTDGSTLRLYDSARSCCESRYLTCDDDLDLVTGGMFLGAEVRDIGEKDGKYDMVHEESFLIVHTSVRDITVTAHNEHNGYYGGISLSARYSDIEGA